MDIRKLRHIAVLADTGHFGRAAHRLGLTQSALTRSIQAAENELELRLFDRGHGHVVATRAAEALLADGRPLLRQMVVLERNMARLARGEAGELRCGLGPMVASLLLPEVLATLARDHAGLVVGTRLGDVAELQRLLSAGDVDFIVLSLPLVAAQPAFTLRRIGAVTLGALVRAGHPLSGQRVQAAELARYPIIGGTPPAGFDGPAYQPTIACDNYEIARSVTLASDAVWITATALAGAALEVLDLDAVGPAVGAVAGRVEIVIAALAGRTLSPPALLAIELMTAALRRFA